MTDASRTRGMVAVGLLAKRHNEARFQNREFGLDRCSTSAARICLPRGVWRVVEVAVRLAFQGQLRKMRAINKLLKVITYA